jgi:hypothetical protein
MLSNPKDDNQSLVITERDIYNILINQNYTTQQAQEIISSIGEYYNRKQGFKLKEKEIDEYLEFNV